MADLYRYGNTDRIHFKLTLNGEAVTGLTLVAGDVKYSTNGSTSWTNVTISEITEKGNGWYFWTPSTGVVTSCKELIVNIKDQSSTALFDENGLQFYMGGNVAARLDGV